MTLRVLIASDDLVVRRILQRSLTSLGHEVEVHGDGEAAWTSICARPVDVILSDWVMPSVSGLELCERLREMQADSYTYFILVTAADRDHNLERAMASGVDDYLSKPINLHELTVRLHVAARIAALQDELASQRQALEAANAQLFETGRRDPLTGLWNRRQLVEDVEQMVHLARRYRRPVCLALCDVDFFKPYNDSFGHVAGDEVLTRIAAALRSASRVTDRVYRYGGEEFMITLPEVDLAGARVVGERIRRDVESLGIPHPDVGSARVVTISCGISQFDPRHDLTMSAWIERTDQGLYAAKEAGRNQVCDAPAAEGSGPAEASDPEVSSRG